MSDDFWYVYFLRCSDSSLYCGITNNLQRRLREHNLSKRAAKYTRSRRPVEVVWSREVESRSRALKLEAMLKKKSKSQKERIVEIDSDCFSTDQPADQ